jgi:hypothetical protein
MAMPWLRWLAAGLLWWRPRFSPGSVYVGFVDKGTPRQVFLWVPQFPLSVPFHHGSLYSYYHLGGEQQAHWWPQFRNKVSPNRHEPTKQIQIFS